MNDKLNFDIKTTDKIKGIALIFMFASHLFTFPDWLCEGNGFISLPVRSSTAAYFFGKFGGICICMFMFLTGYGMFYSYKKGNAFAVSVKKAGKFLLKYWLLIFTFFIPVQLLCGRTYFDPSKWYQELLGIYTSIVGFAWYVRFYLLTMLTLPLLKKLIGKNPFISIAACTLPFTLVCVLLRILSTHIVFHNAGAIAEEYFRYISVVLLGYCFAKYALYDKIDSLLTKFRLNRPWLYIAGVLLIFVLRVKILPAESTFIPTLDLFYVPVFIFFTVKLLNVFNLAPISRCLETVGQNSMNLWFLQSIFFFQTKALQWIVYLPKFSVLILLWNIALLLPLSWLYNMLYKKLRIL